MDDPKHTLDYATPTRRPGRARFKKWARRLTLALLLLASLYTALLAWLYWGWAQEQPAREMARAGGVIVNTETAGPAFLERLVPARLGWIRERITQIIFMNKSAGDADLSTLRGLSRLKGLWLNGMPMGPFPNPVPPGPGAQVTDAGLVHLKGLTGLQQLSVGGTRMTDAGLVHLKGLTRLHWLYLDGTRVTDTGLVHLKGLTGLQELSLAGTRVTDAGMAELQKALPGCQITRATPMFP